MGLKVSAPATFNPQPTAISQILNLGVLVFISTGRKIDSSFKIAIHLIPFFKSYIHVVANFYFSFVSTSFAYITIPKNNRKVKITSEIKF